MFSENQMKSIKILASMTRITNDCFGKCVTDLECKELSKTEIICLQTCSESFVKLRTFIQSQLFEDYESIIRKNKQIYDDKT
jgi:hypothetical protein